MSRHATAVLSFAALVLTASFATGCGGSGNDTTSATPQTTPKPAAGTLTVRMNEFSFSPRVATAEAGKLRLTAPNEGKVPHELVLFKTDRAPGSFKVSGGEVNEAALEASGAKSPGEVADVPPGKSKSSTVKLVPGKYAMICNLPGHYSNGMYGSLTVR